MKRLRRLFHSPAFALFLIAPLAELITGSMPPLEFFPIAGLIVAFLYGSGALLAREAVIRWGKGWFSLLLLGIAYGIYEEGIVVRSFFDPGWIDLDVLGEYGRAAGVNWVWSVHLTQFHALVSIVASVAVVELLYPHKRTQPWLSRRGIVACVLALLAWVPLGSLINPYAPPVGWYLLAWLSVGALIWAAKRLPARPFPPRERAVPRPRRFWWLGFVGMTVYFLGIYIVAGNSTISSTIPSLVLIALVLVWDTLVLRLALRWSGNGYAWNDRHKLALVAGELWFFVLWSFAAESDGMAGMLVVGISLALALEWMARRVRRRVAEDVPLPTEIAPPQPA